MKRICIFAGYSKTREIEPYVEYFLQKLKEVTTKIVYVSDCEISNLDRLSALVDGALCERHQEYDFGSYKRGFHYAEKRGWLNDADELVFCNDSCYGPIWSLKEVFQEESNKDCDFWGFLKCGDCRIHIQSFFMVFKRNVFLHPSFINFVNSFTHQDSFWGYVDNYERRFTEILANEGFSFDAAVKLPKEIKEKIENISGNGNITLWPITAIRNGFPFVKAKALNNGFAKDLRENPVETLEEISKLNPDLAKLIKYDLAKKEVRYAEAERPVEDVVRERSVISFDIFDTLLVRPFKKPVDLFKYIEECFDAPGFAEARISAENLARKSTGKKDVSIDEIYEKINPKTFEAFKEVELQTERKLLTSNPCIRKYYEEAVKQGKRIIAISDMYLPSSFLNEVLKEQGFDKVSKVYVSNELDKVKFDGSLFEHVISELACNPKDIVHFGDNPGADVIPAKRLGMGSCFSPSLSNRLLDDPAQSFYQNAFNSESLPSCYVGIWTLYHFEHGFKNKFFEMGFKLGGPFAVGYSEFVYKQALENGVDHLLFVSRDGDTLKKAFDILYPKTINNSYIFASRSTVLHCLHRKHLPQYAEKAKKIFEKELGVAFSEKGYDEWIEEGRSEYLKYLKGLNINGDSLATVDLTTGAFSAASLMKDVFKDKFKLALCSLAYPINKEVAFESYCGHSGTLKDERSAVLIEELLSSPEYSCKKIQDGKPVYNKYSLLEEERIRHYLQIEEGLLEFVKLFKRFFGNEMPNFTYEQNEEIQAHYIANLHLGDVRTLKSIFHSDPYQPETNQTLYSAIMNRSRGIPKLQNSLNIYSSFKYRKRKLINKLSFGIAYRNKESKLIPPPVSGGNIDLMLLTKYCVLQFIPRYKKKLCVLLNDIAVSTEKRD